MGAEQSVEAEPTPAETGVNKSIGLGRFLSPPEPPSTIAVQDEAGPEPEPEPKQVTPEPSYTGAAQEEVLCEEPEIIETTLSTDDVETLTPSEVVNMLNGLLVKTDVELDLVTACLLRVRVLCRNVEERTTCDELCAAAAVVNAMKMTPNVASLQLAGLSALVNLSGGDADNPRRRNVNIAGGLPVIVAAMVAQPESVETQHMGCMALGNVCYGEDPPSLVRRRAAMQAGGIEAVLFAMDKFAALKGSQELGSVTLQLMVHRMPELRDYAIATGAKAEWLKEPGSPSSSNSSNRSNWSFGTLGTSRKNDYFKANKR